MPDDAKKVDPVLEDVKRRVRGILEQELHASAVRELPSGNLGFRWQGASMIVAFDANCPRYLEFRNCGFYALTGRVPALRVYRAALEVAKRIKVVKCFLFERDGAESLSAAADLLVARPEELDAERIERHLALLCAGVRRFFELLAESAETTYPAKECELGPSVRH